MRDTRIDRRSKAGGSARFRLLLLAAILVAVAIGDGADAAIRYKRSGGATLGGADVLAGVREACEVDDRHVWVEVERRGECVAFYASSDLKNAKIAVVYFEGDIPPSFRRNAERLGSHLRSMQRALELMGRTYRVPYVLMARPGTFGSTGNHADRRKDREAIVMREAISALRRRFNIGKLALSGQSGGATLGGALLALGLTHVSCAALASGGFDLVAMLDWHAQKQGLIGSHREHPATLDGNFDVIERLGGVVHDPARRVFVIGDEADKVTPFAQQSRFARLLREMGHHAQVVQATGSGPDHHGLTVTALKIAGLCATGASDDEVRKAADR